MVDGHYVRVDNMDLYAVEAGSGQPVILLHGSLGTHANWLPYFESLAPVCRVIAPDLRGHGKTVSPQPISGFDVFVSDIVAFIAALGLEKPTLCGWSMGGDLALRIAVSHPEVVGRLIVGGVTIRVSDKYQQTLMAMGLEPSGAVNFARAHVAVPDLIANWKTIHAQTEDHWQKLLSQLAPKMLNPSLLDAEKIASIDAKTLVIWGDRDQFLPVSDAVELYGLLPNAQLAVVPNADHFVTRTHVPAVSMLIKDFVTSTP